MPIGNIGGHFQEGAAADEHMCPWLDSGWEECCDAGHSGREQVLV